MEDKLKQLIKEGESFTFQKNCEQKTYGTFGRVSMEMRTWEADVENFILTNYGKDSSPWRVFCSFDIDAINGYYQDTFEEQMNIIMSALKACERITPSKKEVKKDESLRLENLFKRFHFVAKQRLRNRYNNRATIEIKDEYDVQDLLHALFKIYFNDIRKEEWTPSYAGGSSRMDFLLKDYGIVIEVKKTREGLNDKELGKQLIEDKEKYKAHPDCKKLICFTYDPEGRIVNPKGIQNDLNKQEKEFEVCVVIEPSYA